MLAMETVRKRSEDARAHRSGQGIFFALNLDGDVVHLTARGRAELRSFVEQMERLYTTDIHHII